MHRHQLRPEPLHSPYRPVQEALLRPAVVEEAEEDPVAEVEAD